MKRCSARMLSVFCILFASAALSEVTMTDIWRWGIVRKVDSAWVNSLVAEQDLSALRTYHYGSAAIVESPTNWFKFNAANGTITEFNWAEGRENVVIPWSIGGVPVTVIGICAFEAHPIESLLAPKTLTSIGLGAFGLCTALSAVSMPSVTQVSDSAFDGCENLVNVSLPSAATIGGAAFRECYALQSIALPAVTTLGDVVFQGCEALTSVYYGQNQPSSGDTSLYYYAPNVTSYVTSPTATGWGGTFPATGASQRPVVRLPLYSDSFTGKSLTVSGTARATTCFQLGPTIGNKTAHIFSNGTNLWFVNVNSVTNALTNN